MNYPQPPNEWTDADYADALALDALAAAAPTRQRVPAVAVADLTHVTVTRTGGQRVRIIAPQPRATYRMGELLPPSDLAVFLRGALADAYHAGRVDALAESDALAALVELDGPRYTDPEPEHVDPNVVASLAAYHDRIARNNREETA